MQHKATVIACVNQKGGTGKTCTAENLGIGMVQEGKKEFMLSKRMYQQITGREQQSDVIAYQIRQSFKPGEITAEEANRLGYELAMRFTKGKYAFIIATHTDRAHMSLLKTPAVDKITKKRGSKNVDYVTPATVKKIHNILRSCFHQAVKWDLMEKNPAVYATVPKAEAKKREIWDAPTLFHALEVCEDERLKLAINLAFACSLRMGELLGLTWDCVDITPESIAAGKAYSGR